MGAVGSGEVSWQGDLTGQELEMMVSLPGSPAAKAAQGTVYGLRSHLIFTLSFGCCKAAKINVFAQS